MTSDQAVGGSTPSGRANIIGRFLNFLKLFTIRNCRPIIALCPNAIDGNLVLTGMITGFALINKVSYIEEPKEKKVLEGNLLFLMQKLLQLFDRYKESSQQYDKV